MNLILKSGLITFAAVWVLIAGVKIYHNTPLGCFIEENPAPPSPGTPEHEAVKHAVAAYKKVFPPTWMNDAQQWVTEGWDMPGRNRQDYWFITFHSPPQKTMFGCDQWVRDDWVAVVRKRDLKVMLSPESP
jgi:hypothetical protein